MSPFCRDCLTTQSEGARRCRACGSPRLLDHPARDRLTIAHVDCDAFYAAVEKRDDPSLRDRPLIVGGGKRGVVATACYLARISGVRSAMPMFEALKHCPEAVVIKPDMEKYARVGREVRSMMLALTPLVEPVSIDEAFLDLSGTERLHGASPALTLARFAARVEAEIGITVSVGLSVNKFLAKIASDLDKPRGFSIIAGEDATAFLSERPVGILPGIGESARNRLAGLNVHRVGDLTRVGAERLHGAIGRDALRLLALAEGRDARAVRPT
ncbi:MAG: DNA polymerase IV, partial [Methylorubrum rhodinum]|uniref:DNA polymerase IV n=1 Tax=Methylorubrum rhodinum TaxID=29428 RepID=UPI003BB1ED54